MDNDKVVIYTDGACSGNPGPGGWGAVLCYKGYTKEIYGGEKETTNQRMELMACIKALEELKKNELPVEIYTDSAYIANCFQEGWHKAWMKNGWKTKKNKVVENKDLWVRLLQLSEVYNVKYIKVKSHSGITLNEIADKLAKKGLPEK